MIKYPRHQAGTLGDDSGYVGLWLGKCGLVSVDEMWLPQEIPPFDETMEAIAALIDQALTPKDGGDASAGKAIIRDFATAALAQLEQLYLAQEHDSQETIYRL